MNCLSHAVHEIALQRQAALLQEAAHARLVRQCRPICPHTTSLRTRLAAALRGLASVIDDRSVIGAPQPLAVASL